jgi:DNA repair exonuclease SbcCD ATPase subunit
LKSDKQKEGESFSDEIQKINEILAKESTITTNSANYKRKIKELEDKIEKLKTQVITIDETKIKAYRKKKKELEEKHQEQANLKAHYQTLRTLFSDDGIKTFIIKKYLPHINKLLNHYLSKFSASMVFNFDTEFNEVVLTKYKEDFSYFSFSEGEKKRIDLAVLFSFIKFAMQKNKKSDTNLLIFDEVTSGLDDVGAEALYTTMKEYRNQYAKCIININHNDVGSVEYDKIFECKIDKGFSQMTEVLL